MYRFVNQPAAADFADLATHLDQAAQDALHKALWDTRTQVADRLRNMAAQPELETSQSAYHALRLLVWD
jgi:hypothetical protein